MPNRRMRSVQPSRFSMVPRNDIPRSAFDLSHTHKTTFDAGELIPILVHEVLPGDSLRLNMTALCRLATPIVPIMDNLHLESFFFFCPNRLVWDNFQRFMGEQESPADTTGFLIPQVQIPDAAPIANVGFIYDYMGAYHGNPGAGATLEVSALPFRMYNLIWNEFFRDEDLDTPVAVPTGDGPDTIAGTGYSVLSRRKRHDYFTSARPWPQKPSNVGETGDMGGAGPYQKGYTYSFPDAGVPVSGIGIFGGGAPVAGPPTAYTGNRSATPTLAYGSANIILDAQPAGNFPDVRVLINDIRTANQIQ